MSSHEGGAPGPARRGQRTEDQSTLHSLVEKYVEEAGTRDDMLKELEVRFGTRGRRRISRMDYDNVIRHLLSVGFTVDDPEGENLLRISSEYVNKSTGSTMMSNIRAELEGLVAIRSYCESNTIPTSEGTKVQFVRKGWLKQGNTTYYPADIPQYNLRVALSEEEILPARAGIVKGIMDTWTTTRKVFRYLNRVKLVKAGTPIKVECSIVKMNTYTKGRSVPYHTIQEANVFNNPESYEIELEAINSGMKGVSIDVMEHSVKKYIKYVLGGLQGTNYPVPYPELERVGDEYVRLTGTHKKQFLRPTNFIGPSSLTLQRKDIIQGDDYVGITSNYTVTDKADGQRKLLLISGTGRIYLVKTDMSFEFTGTVIKEKKFFNSLLDGEHIPYGKRPESIYINLYACFDVYFIGGVDYRQHLFSPDKASDARENFRLPILQRLVSDLQPESVVAGGPAPLHINVKQFYSGTESSSIFSANTRILDMADSNMYEYETDGLIFTPANYGVGLSATNNVVRNHRITWDKSFKWKPPEYNTVDFLVSVKKHENGQDFVGNLFESGSELGKQVQIIQYKTLILKVGFDSKRDGYMHPCLDVFNDSLPKTGIADDEDSYKPMPFWATNPSDPASYLTNIVLRKDGSESLQMFTEEGEMFGNNTIVEFRYSKDDKSEWRWKPIRVRGDKTAELRKGMKNFGNNYNTANSNWHSIHHPITKHMIKTGENVPEELADDDGYYARSKTRSLTRSLRDFHNLYVKRILILGASKPGDNLIDFAVGKGGDFPKWIAAKLSFVFGIDISKDNIENHLDGACARYLNYTKESRPIPRALFVQGDSGYNVRSSAAVYSDKEKHVTKAVFGEGEKNEARLGKGVYRQFGVAKAGFDMSSVQFALHYFFEDLRKLHNFARNASECTKVSGMFIGTCYDGVEIFKLLRDKKTGEHEYIGEPDHKTCEITKLYSKDVFPDDASSLGYPIGVYQDTIGKTFKEYLVNFKYFTQVMEDYGFVVVDGESARDIGLPSGTGLFGELFDMLKKQSETDAKLRRDVGSALGMSVHEKKVSFLNRYFVFKKMRDVDAQALYHSFTDVSDAQSASEEKASDEASAVVDAVQSRRKVKVRKLKKRITLEEPKRK